MWFGICDIKTGKLLSEAPLEPTSGLERVLQQPSTGSFKLALKDSRCPVDWEEITRPWRSWIIAVTDENVIVWAGMITGRARNESTTISLACSTPEEYLNRRYVPDKTFKKTDQSTICEWLVGLAIPDGVPFRMVCPKSGIKRDRTYKSEAGATILKRLTELSGVIKGPEWNVKVDWVPDETNTVAPVFQCGTPDLGVRSDRPLTVFSMPGDLVSFNFEERAGEGEFATHVVTTGAELEDENNESTGDRLISAPHIAEDIENSGYPRVEHRRGFDTVQKQTTLESHAARLLQNAKHGVNVFQITQQAGVWPQLGLDWEIGDDVRLIVEVESLKLDQVLRVVGWEISQDLRTVTPFVASLVNPVNDEEEEE